jgi:TRAP-type mannitol/chloroaromatic compound transport system permease large subunit
MQESYVWLHGIVFMLGGRAIRSRITAMPGGAFGAMLVVMALMFVMGLFLDFIEIIFVVVPIVGPILLGMELHPVWFGVMIAINLQTSFLTPPFGFALFYLRGVAPASVTTMDIYRGIIPFVLIQIVGLCIVAYWLGLATWLPEIFSDSSYIFRSGPSRIYFHPLVFMNARPGRRSRRLTLFIRGL